MRCNAFVELFQKALIDRMIEKRSWYVECLACLKKKCLLIFRVAGLKVDIDYYRFASHMLMIS